MFLSKISRSLLILGCTALGAMHHPAHAQEAYPVKPVRLIIPFAAGGGTDTLARMISEKLSDSLGQSLIVENRPGANGIVATTAVANSAADGYTVLMMNAGIVQNPALQSNLPYKPDALVPVAQVTTYPSAFAVNTASGFQTLNDLVAYTKAEPDRVSFGSWGVGSGGHFYGEVFNIAADIDMLHVPYQGESPAIMDLLGGRVTAVFGSPGIIAPHVESGKLKILAVTAPERLKAFPNVPTFTEAGYPAVNLAGWGGFFVPAGTPPAIVERLSTEIVNAVQSPDVSAKIFDFGWVPTPVGSKEFRAFYDTEAVTWRRIVEETGIKAQ